jgi:hypothetical protein
MSRPSEIIFCVVFVLGAAALVMVAKYRWQLI